jgi:hypothetical protein
MVNDVIQHEMCCTRGYGVGITEFGNDKKKYRAINQIRSAITAASSPKQAQALARSCARRDVAFRSFFRTFQLKNGAREAFARKKKDEKKINGK